EKGLILPPKIAPYQVVIIPIFRKEEEKAAVMKECDSIFSELKALGIRCKVDDNEQTSPGFKFNEWELKGAPLRIHIGPRDIENNVVELARRDTLTKSKGVPRLGLAETIDLLLNEIQVDLLERNRTWREENTRDIDDFDNLNTELEKGGFLRVHWCGSSEHEAEIKDKTKATIRVKPFKAIEAGGKCIVSGHESPSRVYIGRAY
ncbi:MAG TPA: His/Gly/Thr/Pro-type tRNA ligase C-terminal domain-containing protein, partial [Vampirovibrionales bacterium]